MKYAESIREEVCNNGFKSTPGPEVYGPQYRDHLLEQYKIYVNTLNHTSDLKQKVNIDTMTVPAAVKRFDLPPRLAYYIEERIKRYAEKTA